MRVCAVLVAGGGVIAAGARAAQPPTPAAASATVSAGRTAGPGSPTAAPGTQGRPSIGIQVLTLTDRSRVIRLAHRQEYPRSLVTYVRYPIPPASPGTPPVAPARAPLIVFAHGFNVRPSVYDRLLDAWTLAGYVVAAPVFPRERPDAPGGPTQADLFNEPGDVSFVISELLRRSAEQDNPLSGRIDRGHIAVAGHSDGGIVALSVAYDRYYRDPRIGAAVILSGARPGDGGLDFKSGPPLLASMGTADTTNRPLNTLRFFRLAQRPKFLLELVGAAHLPPFSYAQPWLGIVERVSTAFLNAYLKPSHGSAPTPPRFGYLPRSALLDAQP